MASDKNYTKKINRYLIRTIYGTFPQCDLVTSRQEMSKRAKFIKTLLFFKRINFELSRNIMHQMKSLSESFIPPLTATETLYYPGYVRQQQKKRQIQAKRENLHEETCSKTVSQPIKIKADHEKD